MKILKPVKILFFGKTVPLLEYERDLLFIARMGFGLSFGLICLNIWANTNLPKEAKDVHAIVDFLKNPFTLVAVVSLFCLSFLSLGYIVPDSTPEKHD